MKIKLLVGMFACLFIIGCIISLGSAKTDDAGIVYAPATDPLNATYIVEGQKIRLIDVDSPLPGSRVASPLRIRGHARGKWFFEGDFPVILSDANGKFIAQGYATAKNGWMTEMLVPFESVIKFKPPGSGSKGTLVLKKDNPTGRPEFDDALEIQVFFK